MKRFYGSSVAGILGVALLGSAPAAQAVEWQINDDTTFSVYGSIELIVLNERQKTQSGEVEDFRQLKDRDTTLGFEGEHRISDNLIGFFRAEFEYAGDESTGEVDSGDGGIAETDEVFVGVKGPWGRLQAGTWDGVYEDLVVDKIDVFEYDGVTKFEDYRTPEVGDAVAYMSPSFGGVSFAVQGFFKGRGEENDAEQDPKVVGGAENEQALQLVVGYKAENYAIHAGYDDNGLDENADGTFGISGSVDLSPLSLAVKYEHVGENRGDPANPNDTRGAISAYTLVSAYDYGQGSVIAIVQQVEPETSDSRTEFGLHVNYSLAENFYVYAEHISYNRDQDLGNYTGAGLVYEF